jgi:hypothetical protein
MEIFTPGGGSIFDSSALSATNAASAATPERLGQALDALAQGRIEFVGLGEGDQFVQAAGQGEGPYLLQYQPPGGGAMVHVPAGADRATVVRVFHQVLAGDPAWHQGLTWQPL